jgi:hypothetical protein
LAYLLLLFGMAESKLTTPVAFNIYDVYIHPALFCFRAITTETDVIFARYCVSTFATVTKHFISPCSN